MFFVDNVIWRLHRFLGEGCEIVLATLVDIEGASPRPVGSQIGVASDGRHVGMMTGGCAERAIAAEALRCLERKENRLVRYGAGSPYRDIELPCGSGIDVYFEVLAAEAVVRRVHARQAQRQETMVSIDLAAFRSSIIEADDKVSSDRVFTLRHEPEYRLMVFGEGTNLVTFCRLGIAAAFEILAFSPDKDALEHLGGLGVSRTRIHRRTDFGTIPFDQYSAVVTLFHEHDWETQILHAALESHADYIGALGSRRTHRQRLETLSELPPTRRAPDAVRGPVGLDIGAQNPAEIGVSILAEIIEHRRRARS